MIALNKIKLLTVTTTISFLAACATQQAQMNNDVSVMAPSTQTDTRVKTSKLDMSDDSATETTVESTKTSSSKTDATLAKADKETATNKTNPGKVNVDKANPDDKKNTGKMKAADVAVAANKASKVTSWELSGAMAARSKNKSWSASINWYQKGSSNYQIRLFGPMGSGTVLIERHGGVINFKDGPKTASSGNAEQLLMKQTGVRLPVNSLYYWVRGVPAPGAVQSAQRDTTNHLRTLRQAGYAIEYNGYTRVGGIDLPNQIRLQGNGIFIKLVVKRWKI